MTRVQEAEAEYREAQSWVCESCGKFIERDETKPWCVPCHDYWTKTVPLMTQREWDETE